MELEYSRYTVESATSLFSLETYVENRLKEGWKCQGGIYISLDKYENITYYQAMVK